MMARLTIRTRLILLTSAGLLVLIATNSYLTHKLADNSAGMVTAAELLKSIEEANSAQIAFGEMRYWMTDLAVSQLTFGGTERRGGPGADGAASRQAGAVEPGTYRSGPQRASAI